MELVSAACEVYEIAYYTKNCKKEGNRAEFRNFIPLITNKNYRMFRSSVNFSFESVMHREDYHLRLTVFFT